MAFIEPHDLNVRGILTQAQTAYIVPLYQRPYAWRGDQWEELLEDITILDSDDTHFLGSMVVVPQGDHRAGVNYFEIVDGQQRLATILIWLCAIRDNARNDGNRSLANFINSTFLFSKDFRGSEEISIPKLKLGEQDNDAFSKVLNSGNLTGDNPIFDCYNFFSRRTKKDEIDDILEKILDKIYLVHINAFSNLNAFRLFETLNDRGLELTAVDLIKNYVLMQISSNKSIFTEAISQWNEIYEKVGSKEPVKFIRRYTLSRYKGKVPETRLYEALKGKLKDLEPEQVLEFVADLNAKSSIYKKIIEGGFASQEINGVLLDLSLVEVGPSYTLLLKLLPYYESGHLQVPQTVQLLRMIETFHLRWGICGQSTSSLDQIYNDISLELEDKDPDEYVGLIKQRLTKELKAGADDIAFERNFISRSFRSTEFRTKYILWKLSEPTGETLLNLREIQTEHVMPQTLSQEWYLYLKNKTGETYEEIKQQWNESLNRIGNLAIMKGIWNEGNSNRLFQTKIDDYKRSEFPMTRDLSAYPEWTFSELYDRSKKMAQLALKIWKWVF